MNKLFMVLILMFGILFGCKNDNFLLKNGLSELLSIKTDSTFNIIIKEVLKDFNYKLPVNIVLSKIDSIYYFSVLIDSYRESVVSSSASRRRLSEYQDNINYFAAMPGKSTDWARAVANDKWDKYAERHSDYLKSERRYTALVDSLSLVRMNILQSLKLSPDAINKKWMQENMALGNN